MVDPAVLCRKHLLGEHLELHMFVGTIKRGTSIQGYAANNLLESRSISFRHEQLVQEMQRRGYDHASPLVFHDKLNAGEVNRDESLRELLSRCKECRERYQQRYTTTKE